MVMIVVKVTMVTLLIKVVIVSRNSSYKLCLIFVPWKRLKYF